MELPGARGTVELVESFWSPSEKLGRSHAKPKPGVRLACTQKPSQTMKAQAWQVTRKAKAGAQASLRQPPS